MGFNSVFASEVPSPSGSDDSGIGLSPIPPPGDLRACAAYASESPQESHFVSRSFYAGECAEGGAFSNWAYNQPGPDLSGSYLTVADPIDNNNKKLPATTQAAAQLYKKDSLYQELDSFLETITATQQEKPANKIGRKKGGSQALKRSAPDDLNTKQILKLERCLQPKTGNGKPRQTSSKRKMNQTRRGDGRRPAVYPGVRPRTVREELQQMRKLRKGMPVSRPQRQQQQQQPPQRPMQFPTQNQPVMPHVPPPMAFPPQQPSHAPDFLDQFRPAGSPPLRYASPASNYSETPPPSYISDGSSATEMLGDFCDPGFDEMGVQPNVSPFDQSPMCGPDVFTCAEPSYLQSASPASTVAVGSPYQNPAAACYPAPAFQQPQFAPAGEYNDMQAFVTTQNFVPSQENFATYSCMSGEPIYETSSAPSMMSPYTPVTCVEGDENFMLIHQLVVSGNVKELSMRLTQVASNMPVEQIVNAKDDKGMTPLLYAAKIGNVEMAGELLKWGADPSVAAGDGQTVLHFAAELEDPNMLSFLASNVPLYPKLVNSTATKKAGRTPLHIATERKRQTNMVLLMQHGASLTAQEQRGGWSALHMAVKNADVKATQEILSFAAYGTCASESAALNKARDLDALRQVVCQPAYNENTAIHFAAELQATTNALVEAQSLIINLLLDNEADPGIKNHQNQLPINLLSSPSSQLYERLRSGRRMGHGGRAPSGGQCDLSQPPLRPMVGAQPVVTAAATVRFGGPSSGVAPRTSFLE